MKKQQYGHVERSSDVVYQDEVETCAEQSSLPAFAPATAEAGGDFALYACLRFAALRLTETFSVRTNYSGVVTL